MVKNSLIKSAIRKNMGRNGPLSIRFCGLKYVDWVWPDEDFVQSNTITYVRNHACSGPQLADVWGGVGLVMVDPSDMRLLSCTAYLRNLIT